MTTDGERNVLGEAPCPVPQTYSSEGLGPEIVEIHPSVMRWINRLTQERNDARAMLEEVEAERDDALVKYACASGRYNALRQEHEMALELLDEARHTVARIREVLG